LVFAAIRAARPPKLYISADGPRVGRAEDFRRCQAAREIAQSVDWPCEVKTLFENIWMISGSNLISKYTNRFEESYFVSNVPLIWGWASWRRAWQHYDVAMTDWSAWKKTSAWKKLFNHDWLAVSY